MKRPKNKYRNVKTTVDGVTFDSRKEARVYGELKIAERASEITHLECHPKFDLLVNSRSVGTYTADFSFFDRAKKQRRIVDVKAPPTAGETYFRFKKKVFEACYPGLEIEIW